MACDDPRAAQCVGSGVVNSGIISRSNNGRIFCDRSSPASYTKTVVFPVEGACLGGLIFETGILCWRIISLDLRKKFTRISSPAIAQTAQNVSNRTECIKPHKRNKRDKMYQSARFARNARFAQKSEPGAVATGFRNAQANCHECTNSQTSAPSAGGRRHLGFEIWYFKFEI